MTPQLFRLTFSFSLALDGLKEESGNESKGMCLSASLLLPLKNKTEVLDWQRGVSSPQASGQWVRLRWLSSCCLIRFFAFFFCGGFSMGFTSFTKCYVLCPLSLNLREERLPNNPFKQEKMKDTSGRGGIPPPGWIDMQWIPGVQNMRGQRTLLLSCGLYEGFLVQQ